MKTLVIYDSVHGHTEHCLKLLAGEVGDLELWPLAQRQDAPAWGDYDTVLIGGPVYFGRWSARLRRFLTRHRQAVAGLASWAAFVVSLSPKASARGYLTRDLADLGLAAPAKAAFFGGAITWSTLTFVERQLLRWGRGLVTDAGNLDLAEIHGLAVWVQERSGAGPSLT